jgi:hypothetical protein
MPVAWRPNAQVKPSSRGFEVRRYDELDASSVWRLHDEGLRQMDAHAGDGPWDDDLQSVGSTYLSNKGEFLVGSSTARWWMSALRRVSSTVGEVKRMRVDVRFQRQGSDSHPCDVSKLGRGSSATERFDSTRRSSRFPLSASTSRAGTANSTGRAKPSSSSRSGSHSAGLGNRRGADLPRPTNSGSSLERRRRVTFATSAWLIVPPGAYLGSPPWTGRSWMLSTLAATSSRTRSRTSGPRGARR